MTKGNLHSAGLACLILVTVLSCLVSFNLLLEKFDAKIASKDDIIASMNEELLSKNIMVDSMTQEMEKHDELASTNNKLLASNEAIVNSSTQQMTEKRHAKKLLASNKEAIIESDQLHIENDPSTTIPTDGFKAIIMRETELICSWLSSEVALYLAHKALMIEYGVFQQIHKIRESRESVRFVLSYVENN
jgi:hypothetical protein